MNYEEKYNEALERARQFSEHPLQEDSARIVEYIFPELAESEDERIREGILELVRQSSEILDKQNQKDMIAWLEKQGEQNIHHTDIKEKAHQIAWETSKDYDPSLSKEAWCEMAALDMASWLKREVDDAYLQGICDAKNEIEKQGESTITDIEIPFGASDSELQEMSYDIPEGFNAEIKDDRVVIKKTGPKFHEGDWIISNSKKLIYQVIEVKRGIYVIRDNVDNHEYHIGIEECEKSGRLWDIGQDAKDGDVLMTTKTRNCPFIYRKTDYNNDLAYFYVGIDGNGYLARAYPKKMLHHFGPTSNVTPATKEQRDTLFDRIKKAGYEWDAYKKELKKIEPKTLNADNVIEWLDEHVPTKFEDMQNYVNQFKKDFEI